MPEKEKHASRNVSLRPSSADLDRLDALVAAVTDRTGIRTTRGSVAGSALVEGLAVLEQRFRDGGKRGRS